MEQALQIARQKYTENNPDVRELKTRLEVLQKNKETAVAEDTEEQSKKAAATKAPGLSTNVRKEIEEYNARIELLNSQIAQKQKEIDQYTKQFTDNGKNSEAFARNLSAIPIGEQEYATLLREETLAREKYQLRTEALNKAQIASGMESSGQGESLTLLDPATLPNGVEEPNRPLVISIGAAVGLLLGVVIAGAREMKDASLKNLKDVRVYTQMAILGSVPLLENDFVVRRRKRLAWLGWTVACLFAGLIMAGAVVYYYLTLPTVG
jgi:tyrosine-protein kinase Etk/Wzc